MNKMHLSLAVAAALASAAALAQTAPVAAPHAKPEMALDANKDGAIDRTEAARMPRLAERFDQLDANKDGRLTGAERPQPRAMRHRGRGAGHGGMGMRGWDADKDGRVSRAEAQAAQARVMARFDAMDLNKDGYLDRADMQLRMRQQRDAFFATADANKDGRLTRDEFLAGQQARRAERTQRAQAGGKQAAGGRGMDEATRRARAGAAFDRLDANHDGVLLKAEFEAAPEIAGRGRSGARGH